MTEKRKIDVLINGRNFTVVGSDNEAYVRTLASYVDKKIKELTSKNDRLCQTSSATLAALNIADELYKASEKLKKVESEIKDPVEKFDDISSELEKARIRIKDLEIECSKYKDDLLKAKIDKENVNDEAKKYQQTIELKEKELVDSQKMIKSLQDKVFDDQIELIETKKELGELLKRLDNEKNIFIKEEA
jgi:cell division protein ZapA